MNYKKNGDVLLQRNFRLQNEDCKHNNEITELGIICINTTRNCQRKWLQHFERMPTNQMPKMLHLNEPLEEDSKSVIKGVILTF
jgi:hypothetical protein